MTDMQTVNPVSSHIPGSPLPRTHRYSSVVGSWHFPGEYSDYWNTSWGGLETMHMEAECGQRMLLPVFTSTFPCPSWSWYLLLPVMELIFLCLSTALGYGIHPPLTITVLLQGLWTSSMALQRRKDNACLWRSGDQDNKLLNAKQTRPQHHWEKRDQKGKSFSTLEMPSQSHRLLTRVSCWFQPSVVISSTVKHPISPVPDHISSSSRGDSYCICLSAQL